MTDIAVVWDTANARGDWVISNYTLATGPDLLSSVLIRLFTDAPASPDYVPPDGSGYRGGYWGDTYTDTPLGSRLWQLARAKKTDSKTIPLRARDYCIASLQDLLDDGVVASIKVSTGWVAPTVLGIQVELVEPQTGTPQVFSFAWAWNGIGL